MIISIKTLFYTDALACGMFVLGRLREKIFLVQSERDAHNARLTGGWQIRFNRSGENDQTLRDADMIGGKLVAIINNKN